LAEAAAPAGRENNLGKIEKILKKGIDFGC
jgi:hypothetical protein